jgi:FMN hydrolase / 5-amino-6-(5-phospho-D-ribitylamino)uracil phosphatase
VSRRLDGIEAITFDFGNTLVPVGRTALRAVVERTAEAICERRQGLVRDEFLAAWAEERERQFREEVPQFREVDLSQRLVRVFARLAGVVPPPEAEPWDDDALAAHADPVELAWAVEIYSRAFVETLPAEPGVDELIERLARERTIAILSNWPLAATIDRYADARGWSPHLRAIVVSQRVGTIKPHPDIFAAARAALGDPPPEAILHVGDDWAADVVGARSAGWRAAWLAMRPADSPLPSSARDGSVEADVELATLADLEGVLGAVLPRERVAGR